MQVRLLGVSMTVSPDVPMAEVFAELEKHNGEDVDYYGSNRRIYVSTKSGCHVALVITIRDQRRWMQMREDEHGEIIIEPRDIDDDKAMVDFNYLALHQGSGRGLYLHYSNSLSTFSLSHLIAPHHKALLVKAREAWLAKVGRTRKNVKKANDRFENIFALAPIVQQKDLPALLRELDTVSSLQLEFDGVVDNTSLFGPLRKHVEIARYKVNFTSKLSANKVADPILSEIKKHKPKRGRIVGTEDGERRSFEIDALPTTVFGRLEYDQVSAVAIQPASFEDAKQLKGMIAIINHADNASFFVRNAAEE